MKEVLLSYHSRVPQVWYCVWVEAVIPGGKGVCDSSESVGGWGCDGRVHERQSGLTHENYIPTCTCTCQLGNTSTVIMALSAIIMVFAMFRRLLLGYVQCTLITEHFRQFHMWVRPLWFSAVQITWLERAINGQ